MQLRGKVVQRTPMQRTEVGSQNESEQCTETDVRGDAAPGGGRPTSMVMKMGGNGLS